MAEKLSWTELRRALASRAGVSEKTANAFLNAFNAQIVEALRTDKQVKVNGLGTFRLQAVAPRKSVNVTTGEAITIEGYNKIAFTPEIGVKEMVEKEISAKPAEGKSAKPAESEIDPLRKLGEQATEIVDILGELGQSPVEPAKPAKAAKPKRAKAAKKEKIEEPKEEPKAEVKEEAKAEIAAPEVVKPEPVIEPAPAPVAVEPKKAEEPKKRYHFIRDTLICVVILLMLLLVGYFFLRQQISSWIEDLVKPQPAQTEVVESVENVAMEDAMPQDEGESVEYAEASQEEAQAPAAPEVTEANEYAELITIEPMHEASRLAWMAKRYYGDKIYWPYLYDANKDHISNPSQIAVGTPIRVPRLTAAQRDTTSAHFQQICEEAYSKVR